MAYRIIVADQSPTSQKILQLVFSAPDYQIVSSSSVEDLFSLLEASPPDALIISLSLPGIRGISIEHQLRSRRDLERMPLIGLKGTYEPVEVRIEELALFDEIFQKPFDSNQLGAAVRGLIARKTGPLTLPEEAIVNDNVSLADIKLDFRVKESGLPQTGILKKVEGRPLSSEQELSESIKLELKAFLREEVFQMEREVEKRLRYRLITDLNRGQASASSDNDKR